MYDLIIVGGGPAGLSAAIYAARRALKTIVLAKSLGGQTALNLNIENYPGVENISGLDLMLTARDQAEKFGAQVLDGEVKKINRLEQGFSVMSNSGNEYLTQAIILALGRTPRKLNIPGEEKFEGRGVVYCATCDAPLFANKRVMVVGGGNSAADAALLLSKIANQVYLLTANSQPTCEAVLLEGLRRTNNLKLICHSSIQSINGSSFVESATVQDAISRSTEEIPVEGIFVQIGYEVKADFLGDLINRNQSGEIIIDEHNRTSAPGIFAAGDVTTVPFKQSIISAGEGAKAALSAYNYVTGVANR